MSLVKINQDLVESSGKVFAHQEYNSHFDVLSYLLGTLQGEAGNYIQNPSKKSLKTITEFNTNLSKELIKLITISPKNTDFKGMIVTLQSESNIRLTAMILQFRKMPKGLPDQEKIVLTKNAMEQFNGLWGIMGQVKDKQKILLAEVSYDAQNASKLSWRISVFGSIFILVAMILGYFTVSKSKRKQRAAELNEEESERARKEQQEQLESVIDNSTSIIFIKDITGKYTLVNERFRKLMHLSNDQILGKRHDELTAGDFVQYRQSTDYDVLNNGIVQERIEKVTFYKEERDYLTIKFPLRNPAGEIFGLGGISTDITDRTRYENELKQAKKTAEDSKNAQQIFLANMSHELRSPINGVVGIANLLELTPLNGDQREYLDLIRYSSGLLVTLINDILDLSKMQAGMFQFEEMTFDIRLVIEQTIKTYQVKAEQKGIEVNCVIDSEIPTMLTGDPTRLAQILSNLLSNAVKFTHSGVIAVTADLCLLSEDSVQIAIKVADTGIGISAEIKEKIFKSYVQSNSSISRTYGGTGLGLSIIKELVGLQNGEVCVESQIGVGSTFKVVLPFGLSSKALPPVCDTIISLLSLTGKKVLVIEDNPVNQRVAKESLESAGIIAEVADNGFVGLFLLKQNSFDAILLDINMPGMDGYETARKIRKELKISTPIIAVTSYALKEDRESCFAAGMDGFITKPYSIGELLTEINKKITVHEDFVS